MWKFLDKPSTFHVITVNLNLLTTVSLIDTLSLTSLNTVHNTVDGGRWNHCLLDSDVVDHDLHIPGGVVVDQHPEVEQGQE